MPSLPLLLGIAGVPLIAFPDVIVFYTPLRIFVFSCLMIVYVVCRLAKYHPTSLTSSRGRLFSRRSLTYPGWTAVASAAMGGVGYLSSYLGVLDYVIDVDRFAVIVTVLTVLFSTMAAVYFDSVLERRLQKYIIVCAGLAACIIAATLDYPNAEVILTEVGATTAILALRYAVWRRLFRRREPLAGKKAEKKKPDAAVHISEKSEASEGSVQRPSMRKHPLVLRGMIVNPRTDRIIMIGKKTYENLLEEGYQPDDINGVLVKME